MQAPMTDRTERGALVLGIGLTALAALSWSTAGLFPRLVSTDVFTTLFWRSALGGLSVLAFQLVLNHGKPVASLWQLTPAEWGMSAMSAAAMVTFIAAFYFAPIADVVFVYGAFPTVTVLLSALLLRTRIQRADVLCSALVAVGVGIILWGQASLQSIVGTLMSFSATLLFGLMTVGIKRFPDARMVKVTYMGAFLSALAMAPFASFMQTSMHDLGWLWLYGFLNIGVGFGFYLLGVRRIKPVLASVLCMIEIPLAPLWAYLLLGEQVGWQSLVGGAVVLLAVSASLVWAGWRAAPDAPAPSARS
jgi:drug/metabolite transporter (DMT)-like permease